MKRNFLEIHLLICCVVCILFVHIYGQNGGPGPGCDCKNGACAGCRGKPWDDTPCNSTYQVNKV